MKTLPLDAYPRSTPQHILDKHRDTWEAKKQASAERFKFEAAKDAEERARYRCSVTSTSTVCGSALQEEIVDQLIDKQPTPATPSLLRSVCDPILGFLIIAAISYASFFAVLGVCLAISGNWDPSAPQEGFFGGMAATMWAVWESVGPWWGTALWFAVLVTIFGVITNPEILLVLLLYAMWSNREK